ncbi:hypothetical protein RB614_37795 [Phytohabitans sp. ZYX-F-186]|uniref:Uncharacterized protein n=1 Tax=Phytohabitans maris TaxID=3071409 RepID=A0ABU0ZT99_9ACTN|nr:hypothetical protein [Phytohabitans sp. ZYX-F-186]MDQ7910263.1 hypothetical protein [Phytohabitans sp. ZYX-F-186]
MMGVVVGARVYELHESLTGEQYAGVKILAKGLTVGEALDFGEFLDGLRIAPVMSADEIEKRDRSYELFASRLVEWNLETAPGKPLPMSLDGMRALDWTWGRDLIRAWVKAVSGVSDPLGQPSTDGGPSEVASIPMEALSESPGS